jgi:hypothetical protein
MIIAKWEARSALAVGRAYLQAISEHHKQEDFGTSGSNQSA